MLYFSFFLPHTMYYNNSFFVTNRRGLPFHSIGSPSIVPLHHKAHELQSKHLELRILTLMNKL